MPLMPGAIQQKKQSPHLPAPPRRLFFDFSAKPQNDPPQESAEHQDPPPPDTEGNNTTQHNRTPHNSKSQDRIAGHTPPPPPPPGILPRKKVGSLSEGPYTSTPTPPQQTAQLEADVALLILLLLHLLPLRDGAVRHNPRRRPRLLGRPRAGLTPPPHRHHTDTGHAAPASPTAATPDTPRRTPRAPPGCSPRHPPSPRTGVGHCGCTPLCLAGSELPSGC